MHATRLRNLMRMRTSLRSILPANRGSVLPCKPESSRMGDPLTDEVALKRDCEKAFLDADEGRKGYLSPEDYKVAVISLLGYKPSKYEIAAVFKADQSNHELPNESFKLDKAAFVTLMLGRMTQQDADELIRQIFLSFDAHCQGFVTLENCKQAFKQVAPHVKDAQVELFFAEVDSNGDGRVSYRDFDIMMKYFRLFSI